MNIKTQKTLIASLLGASFFLTLPVVANDGCDVGGKYSVRTLENIKVGACSVADGGNGSDNPDYGDDNGGEVGDFKTCENAGSAEHITGSNFDGNSLFAVNEEQLRGLVRGKTYCVNNHLIDTYADTMIDVSGVSNMSTMFVDFGEYIDPITPPETTYYSVDYNITDWNVSNATNMSGMFVGASSFNQDISGWDISNVTDISSMFENASSFNQDIGGWDVSNVSYMSSVFSGASSFNQDIGGWDVSNVIHTGGMFQYASSFNQDISGWDVSNINNMISMFAMATAFNQDISGWDVSNVNSMIQMFSYASSFNYNLSGWCVELIKDRPVSFTNGLVWSEGKEPVWGTCP